MRPLPAARGEGTRRAAGFRAAGAGSESADSRCQTAQLVPAARFLRPGFETLASRTPSEGWRSAESRTGACEAPGGPARNAAGQALARRLASHNAGRPPLGALTVAILGSGAALPSPDLRPDRSQRAPRVRVVVPGWRLSVPPGAAGASRCRRTPRLAPSSGSSLEHAPYRARLANLYPRRPK